MRFAVLPAVAAVSLLVAGCGGSSGSGSSAPPPTTSSVSSPSPSSAVVRTKTPSAKTTPSQEDRLRKAVKAYSDEFLTGDVNAYDLLSKRCRAATDKNQFIGILMAAKTQYGSALPIKSFKASVDGDHAIVTYTYDVSAINQTGEPWVLEQGGWHNDQC